MESDLANASGSLLTWLVGASLNYSPSLFSSSPLCSALPLSSPFSFSSSLSTTASYTVLSITAMSNSFKLTKETCSSVISTSGWKTEATPSSALITEVVTGLPFCSLSSFSFLRFIPPSSCTRCSISKFTKTSVVPSKILSGFLF